MYPISSVFGEVDKIHGVINNGIDISMPVGSYVLSFASGVVEKIVSGGANNKDQSVWIRLTDGYHVLYSHLSDLLVQPGDHIVTRTLIGRASKHISLNVADLHVGIMSPTGHWIDPSRYVAIDQLESPNLIYGVGNWSDKIVSGWFSQIGSSMGNGVENLGVGFVHLLDLNMPNIAIGLLVAGGFLKMLGSRSWSTRMFVMSAIGIGWIVLT